MSEIKREDSFRSEIKKQKRRLSATKLPTRPAEKAEPQVAPADLVDLKMVARVQQASVGIGSSVGKDRRSGSCGEIRPLA